MQDHKGHSTPPGEITIREINQQPTLWLNTLKRASEIPWQKLPLCRGILCGAGTSAYAASAIQSAWPASRAVATTDLLTDPRPLKHAEFLLSLARSGDSPESVGVVELAGHDFPAMEQYAITCSASGQLARTRGLDVFLLDSRTNDRSLVMTSSFSNLVLAGLCFSHRTLLLQHLDGIADRVKKNLHLLDNLASELATTCPARAVVLASSTLFPWAQESCLKLLEMTAGRIAAIPETFLGLRHGPMSFLDRATLVLCLVSGDRRRQLYELDLLRELKAKRLGNVIGIVPPGFSSEVIDTPVQACAHELPDELRTPFEIVFSQLLAYRFSLASGLDPDNPSPRGVINRVVDSVRLHGRAR